MRYILFTSKDAFKTRAYPKKEISLMTLFYS